MTAVDFWPTVKSSLCQRLFCPLSGNNVLWPNS